MSILSCSPKKDSTSMEVSNVGFRNSYLNCIRSIVGICFLTINYCYLYTG